MPQKGDLIKKIRKEKNITQTELAEAIGVSKQTMYKYENNIISNIPSDKIELIAKKLNISPGLLMGWEHKDGYYLYYYFEDQTKQELGNSLRRRREKLNLTQNEVATTIGVDEHTIQKWENGNFEKMKRGEIYSYAEILGVSPNYILGWGEKDDLNMVKHPLIEIYQNLNDEGKENLMRYATDLSEMDKYKKCANSEQEIG